MKTEVLKSIKKAEDEYKSMISAAEEEKRRNIADAELEAYNLIAKAQADAEEYKKKRLADARAEAKEKHDEIVKKGDQSAGALRVQSSTKKDKAVELLITRFKEQLNV